MESSDVIVNKLKSGESVSKGSYCQCHYCKCEKGHVSCKGYGHEGGGYGQYLCPNTQLSILTFREGLKK